MNAANGSCRLLQLPQELRDMIYSHVFSASRIRHGIVYENAEWVDRNARRLQRHSRPENQQVDWVLTEKTYRYVKPTANTLSLLRTCKQIHAETATFWPKHVNFTFDTLETMFDKLSALLPDFISSIRHIQVSPAHTGVKRYALASMLKVVPQLNLDTLTVVMNYASRARQNCPDNYTVIDDLVRYGMGWRKLYYITPDSLMLSSLRFDLDGAETRPVQPAQWVDTLASRDWEEETDESRHAAAPCVRIYRATDSAAGSVLDPAKRAIYTPKEPEKMPSWLGIEDRVQRKAARSKHEQTIRAAERGDKAREMMVVVERRRGRDVVERGQKPYDVNTDFRAWMGDKSWPEYWTCNHHVTATYDGESGDLLDSFDSPYEIAWVASERKGVTWPVRTPALSEFPIARAS